MACKYIACTLYIHEIQFQTIRDDRFKYEYLFFVVIIAYCFNKT